MLRTRTFMAILLGCTMLAGSKEDADHRMDNPAAAGSQGTFAGMQAKVAGLETLLKQKEEQQRAEWQPILADLTSRLAVMETDVTGFKEFGIARMKADVAALTERLNKVDAAVGSLQGIETRLTALGDSIANLEKTALSATELAAVKGLDEQVKGLKADFDKALAAKLELTSLDGLKADIDKLRASSAGKTALEAVQAAIDARLTLLDASNQTGAKFAEELKQRLAKLEKDLKPLLPEVREDQYLAHYVNTMRGANSNAYIYDCYSRGNTFPALAMPFGFNMWSPVNRLDPDNKSRGGWTNNKQYDGDMGNDFFYQFYEDEASTKLLDTIYSFAAVHEPSPWIGNRQSLQIMPVGKFDAAGTPVTAKEARGVKFKRSTETANAHYYGLTFDSGTKTEITPTDHAAYFRFTAGTDQSMLAVIFDNFKGIKGTLVANSIPDTVSGYTDHGSPRMYFHAKFDTAAAASAAATFPAWLRFETPAGKKVINLKIATSFISIDQAKANLDSEIGDKTFDAVKAEAKAAWNEKLNSVQVEGATEDQKIILYSNLYRSFLYPNSAWENVEGKPAYMSPYTNPPSLKSGKTWVNNGFWDTYRTTWPLYTLLMPQQAGEMIDGFVNGYKDGGWVTRWSGPGYNDMMVATSSDVIFADAYLKGVKNFDVNAAYESMLKNATVYSPDSAKGRKGMNKTPFYGYSTIGSEAISWSLEAYLNDFGISQMATALGKTDDAAYLVNSAINYTNLFDGASTGTWSGGWFRQKAANGSWAGAPNPMAWYYGYTEGNAWSYTFLAPQDGQGLANLYGGRSKLKDKLDAFFTTKPGLGSDGTNPGGGRAIKPEIKSAFDVNALADVGQYQHSNQPVHHSIYMYNYAGAPANGQKYLRDVMDKLYFSGFSKDGISTGDGYIGDEDNGEMSAWYVLSAMGFYPVSMGRPEYAVGAPYFPKMKVRVKNAKGEDRAITITAPGVSTTNRYVQSLKLNGTEITRTYLTHAELIDGSTLEFQMGPNPSPSWGTGKDDVPTSITKGDEKPAPLVSILPAVRYVKKANTTDKLAALSDRDLTTVWNSGTGPAWIEASVPAPQQGDVVKLYTLTSRNSAGDDPSSWVLKGSNDGATWITLDKRKNEQFAWRSQVRPFAIKSPTSYAQYRLEFDGTTPVSLAEFELLGHPVKP